MARKEEGFIFRYCWAEELLKLPEDLRGRINDAIQRFALYGEEPTDEYLKYTMYAVIRNQILRDREKYQEVCEKRREAINTRWEREHEAHANTSDTNVFKSIQVNTLTKSLMKSPSLGKNLAIGALSVAAGLLVSGYASGNPLNDPDPATIDQKGYDGVQAAPEMMFSSGQGFAPNNTGGYIINIKGDTRKGNRQLKKALRQATKNATGSGNINMSVKTTQSSGVYSDRDIENILNNYF